MAVHTVLLWASDLIDLCLSLGLAMATVELDLQGFYGNKTGCSMQAQVHWSSNLCSTGHHYTLFDLYSVGSKPCSMHSQEEQTYDHKVAPSIWTITEVLDQIML